MIANKIFYPIILMVLFTFLFIQENISAQSKHEEKKSFVFLPPGLNFQPLKAGSDEAKMGLLYYTKTKNMKVDIGNSFDVFEFNFNSNDSKITVGAEFMAYAYVTSYLEYRLQIDAIDGFFGGNITYSKQYENNKLFLRFRYIHNSAHLVDGHWNTNEKKWIDGIQPSAFGNNYAEVIAANQVNSGTFNMRYYGGLDFSTGKYIGGKDLKRLWFKAGTEFAFQDLLGKILNRNENIYIAVQFDVKGIPEYIVNQNYMAGIKLGDWNGKGVSLYLSYYNGGDVFSQYFTDRVSRFGAGFTFNFF